MDQPEQDLHHETGAYAEAILFPDFAERYDPKNRPQVWAETRTDLQESLEYFRVLKESAYCHQGLIHGFLIDGDSGDRPYIDSEVVIARVINRRAWEDMKDETISDVIVQAFFKTKQMGLSVVLILGKNCPVSPVYLVDRYSVMDHFRISYIWAEKSSRGKSFYKVRFDRLTPHKAWWTPNQPEPPLHRYPSMAVIESLCTFCNISAPQYYAEAWLCTNPSCAFFWHRIDGAKAPEDLTFDRKFLKTRLPDIPWFKPGFDIVPDLVSNLLTLRETGQITATLRSLWKGIVCLQCGKCISRVHWNVWTCDNCDIDFPPDPGYIDIQSVISRTAVSYAGHPMINPVWPGDDFAYHGPVFRQHYRVERWILHENSSITLVSPTAAFNEDTNGPNTLWDEMSASANLGYLGLRRGLLRFEGMRTRYFSSHFGAEYDMSEHSTPALDEAPECVTASMELLNHVGQTELGPLYESPNQVSVNGYWSDMGMNWHTEGEDDIGSTISTLSLGGDAVMRIRLQYSYYHNQIDVVKQDPIMGALDWKSLTELKRRWEAGEVKDEEYRVNPDLLNRMRGRLRPQIDLPLIHGSIVIMTGKALTKYYEHSIEVKDSIRFSVTCRTIDAQARDRIKSSGRRRVQDRLAGPKFTLSRDTVRDVVNGDDPDMSDDGDDEDDSQPTGMVKEKPAPRKLRQGGGRGSGRNSRRPSPNKRGLGPTSRSAARNRSHNRSRSASPSGIRRMTKDGKLMWEPADDDKLVDLVHILGRKWTEIATEFPDKSPAACRLHYMLILESYNSNKNRKPKPTTEKKAETAGAKSARTSPRKGGWKDQDDAE